MRIAFITPSMGLGGYERVILAYANELYKRGHTVDILCGFKQGELLREVSPEINIYDFQARARKFLRPLVSYIKKNKPDLLYCAFREYNCIGVLAKMVSGSKVCVYASQHGFQSKVPWMNYVEGRLIERADRLITVADDIADFESEKLGIARDRFLVFNNPVLDKTKKIQDVEHSWFLESEKIPIIVVSGRLAEDKGKKYCIEILDEIRKSKEVRMIVLGDGPCMSEIKGLVEEKELMNCIDFKGFVDNPLGYMRRCNLFLHTALVEGFGNVVVEALYSNIPVCVTSCSGPLQIIENGKYGMSLGMPSDENFVVRAADKIIQVLEGKVQYSGLVERAMDFEIQASTDQFLAAMEVNHV